MLQPDDYQSTLSKYLFVLTATLLVLLGSRAHGASYKLLDVEKLDIRYSRLDPNTRDPYAPQYTGRWDSRASLNWRVSVLGPLYWDNDVHTETINTGQVKTVGWHWELGLRINKYFTLFQEHHSRHIMDEGPDSRIDSAFNRSSNSFPVEDSIGIRIRIIEDKQGRGLFR